MKVPSLKSKKILLILAIVGVVGVVAAVILYTNKQPEQSKGPVAISVPKTATAQPKNVITPAELIKDAEEHADKEVRVYGSVVQLDKEQFAVTDTASAKPTAITLYSEKTINYQLYTGVETKDGVTRVKPATITGTYRKISDGEQAKSVTYKLYVTKIDQ
jgi:hypothetical protein